MQIDTERLRVEWLFPRRLLQWGVALPFSEVIEVRKDAVIVKDPVIGAPEPSKSPAFEGLAEIVDPASPAPLGPAGYQSP